jgi:pyrroloquinoline quinone (PQQ) biosynthesis protein C
MARSSTPRSTRRSTTSSRSTRRSVTGTRTRTSTPRTVKRNLKYFTFTYNRDDVSHAANANGIVISERGNTGTVVSLSLQEAKSLYDFLATQIRTR